MRHSSLLASSSGSHSKEDIETLYEHKNRVQAGVVGQVGTRNTESEECTGLLVPASGRICVLAGVERCVACGMHVYR